VRKIIVLEQGKVAAQGTPEQFMRQQQAQGGGGAGPRPVPARPAT